MKRSVAVNVGLAPAQWVGQAEGLDPDHQVDLLYCYI